MTLYVNIIHQAVASPVTDIGQLSKQGIRQLNKAVKTGLLTKGKNYNYPIPKVCWFYDLYDLGYANIIPDLKNR